MSRAVVALVSVMGLAACATVSFTAQPFDTTDPVPDEVKPQEVTEASFVQLMHATIPDLRDGDFDRTAGDLFGRPEHTITVLHNDRLRFDAFVSSANGTHYAVVLRTSAQGFPIIPVERLATAVTLNGVPARAQYAYSEQVARCLATNGHCTTLVAFDNGNGFAATYDIDKVNPVFLKTRCRFLKAGTFARSDFMIAVSGGLGDVTTFGQGDGEHKKVPLLVSPRPSPRFGPPTKGDL